MAEKKNTKVVAKAAEVKEEVKKAETAVKAEAAKKVEETKAVAKKAETAVKAAGEKTAAAKKAVEAKTTAAKKAVEEKAAAAKKTVKTAAKKAVKAEKAVKSFVELWGDQYDVEEVIAKAEADFKANNKRKAIADIKVYIKPEEKAAYYVVNGDYPGRVTL